MRVYSGMLEAGDDGAEPAKGKRERIGRLLQMHANKREEIDEVLRRRHRRRGRACKDTITGDTLCDEDQPDLLEQMDSPSR